MRTKQKRFFLSICSLLVLLFHSCSRTSDDVWDDTKSAGRHMQRGIRSLGGKHGDSRQVGSRRDFEGIEDDQFFPIEEEWDAREGGTYQEFAGPVEKDFIPLAGGEAAMGSFVPQPRETPGERGSSLPGIEAFRDPNTIPHMAGIFCPIYFEYNSHLIKGEQNFQALHTIRNYLRARPNTYVFIEGHTDERGPEAYNLALGARRSNAVRNLLVSEGINPSCLFTISYGKERPVVLERHEEGWAKNRRAEFKVYER